MNQEAVINFLLSILGAFHVHPDLIGDLSLLLTGSGKEQKFFNILLARLKYLNSRGVLATQHKEFEPLKDGAGLYSMHLTGSGFNVRILYAFTPDQSPVLLLAFHERAGKRSTDYTPHIPRAKARLNEVMEEYGYEY